MHYSPWGHKELDTIEATWHAHMHACVCVCVCVYIYEYYLAIKNNTIMSFEVTWIGPEIIILSEVSQRKTDII